MRLMPLVVSEPATKIPPRNTSNGGMRDLMLAEVFPFDFVINKTLRPIQLNKGY